MTVYDYPAHIRQTADGRQSQTVADHLLQTALGCEKLLKPVGLAKTGYLSGLLHDMGKLTNEFSDYIQKAASGKSVPRGSVNHTFAGVRWLWKRYHRPTSETTDVYVNATCELLALAVGAHHGQFDCIDPDAKDGFLHRLEQPISYDEAVGNYISLCFPETELDRLFLCAVDEMSAVILAAQKNGSISHFYFSMLYRLVLSALIEADRSDTARFMADIDTQGFIPSRDDWESALGRVEKYISGFRSQGEVNAARKRISDSAVAFMNMPTGIYRLSIPTGGGKTLTSLRAALAHAFSHKKRRIIFTIPLLAILEQNASTIRDAVQNDDWILEHHSNVIIEPNEKNELSENELIAENWHSPIVITTLVQFLNTLFDGKTSCIRRMHALIDSVVVLDEVQTVPVKLLSMFNEAVNFLANTCRCTVVLCSATQPCMEQTKHPMREAKDIVPYSPELWKAFKRTELIGFTQKPMDADSLTAFAADKLNNCGSLLIVCNKKQEALQLFERLRQCNAKAFHISASMCMRHRMEVMSEIKERLSKKAPFICVSTQLMEAGVDLSFGCVIRVMAGLDNLIQAAGRCNRNGEYGKRCPVYCVSWANESLEHLPEIEASQRAMRSLLDAFYRSPEAFENDLSSDKAVRFYYQKLFQAEPKDHQDYYIRELDTSIYSMLSTNGQFAGKCRRRISSVFQQAFRTAGESFAVFDSAAFDVIVPWGDGEKLICEFSSERAIHDLAYRRSLLRQSKLYSVSVFEYELKTLSGKNAIRLACNDSVRLLDPAYYDDQTGVTVEPSLRYQEI